jgi:hypothetical protein
MLRNRRGKFHDEGDAKRIVIRRSLRGHNDTSFGRPALGRPIGRLGDAQVELGNQNGGKCENVKDYTMYREKQKQSVVN